MSYIINFAVPVGPAGGVAVTTSPPSLPVSPDNTVAIIAGVVAVVLIIATAAVIVTVLIIIAFVLRRHRSEFKPSQR